MRPPGRPTGLRERSAGRLPGHVEQVVGLVRAAGQADLVVIGRSGQERRAGGPYVGSQTAHVLEMAEQPVLVVPAKAP